MIKHELRNCPRCGALRSVEVLRPNHVLHAVMTLLTGGLWLIVWAAFGIESLFWRVRVKCPRTCPGRSPLPGWGDHR